jgi:hypothetical protein
MPETDNVTHIFKAGRFWSSNVAGAALAGVLGGILMSTVMIIIAIENPVTTNILFAVGLILVLLVSVLCFIAGNLILAYPCSVSLEQGKGLELQSPLRKLFIPTEDLGDVRKSFFPQPGYMVRLKRRNRLLKSFIVPSYFGDQADLLADAIRDEIQRRGAI